MDIDDYSPMFNNYDYDADDTIKVQVNKRYPRTTIRKTGAKKKPLPSKGRGQTVNNQIVPKLAQR